MVTGKQKEGKRNRIKVIGDVKGRERRETVLQTFQASLQV